MTFNQVVGGSNPPCLNKQKRYCNAVPFLFILKGGFEKEAAEHAEQKRWHAKAKMIPLDHFSDVARESPVSQERNKLQTLYFTRVWSFLYFSEKPSVTVEATNLMKITD